MSTTTATGSADYHWHNWGRTAYARYSTVYAPTSVEQIQKIITGARKTGERLKAPGGSHSFTPIAQSAGAMLDLSAFSGLHSVDRAKEQATFAAATHLYDIPKLLAPYGLAMENLGDVDRQTLAGATSTGTHGTGAKLRGLANQIVGVELVTGIGELLRIDEQNHPQLLPAVRVGLGALGVLVSITMQCVDAFALHAEEHPMPLGTVLDNLDELYDSNDHFEIMWFPGTQQAATKTNHRRPFSDLLTLPGDAPARRGALKKLVDQELLANGLFGLACNTGRAIPALVPAINCVASRVMASARYMETSHNVLVSPRRVHFVEMEYAVPRSHFSETFAEIREMANAFPEPIEFPIEIRCAAADENWLSTAYHQDVAYLAVHRHYKKPHKEYFKRAEAILTAHQGRPHWGKLHTRDASYLRARYPKFDDFLRLRDSWDPDRVFSNDYLRRVFGD